MYDLINTVNAPALPCFMVLHPSREAQHLQISMSSIPLQVFKTRPTSMDLTRLYQGFDILQLLTMPLSIAVLLLASAALGIPLDQTFKLARSGVLLSGLGIRDAY